MFVQAFATARTPAQGNRQQVSPGYMSDIAAEVIFPPLTQQANVHHTLSVDMGQSVSDCLPEAVLL